MTEAKEQEIAQANIYIANAVSSLDRLERDAAKAVAARTTDMTDPALEQAVRKASDQIQRLQ